jgi:peptidoglycan/xylan/chitin deacetylase (PgdA/CDA1 family)
MNTRTRLSAAFLTLALASGVLTDARAAVALIYHRFDDSRHPSTNLSLATFRQQLDWLAANGFEVWSASRLTERLQAGDMVSDKVAVITIDDAYRSLLGAAALLEEYGYPFSVFVSTRPIDQGTPDMLDWNGLRGLCRQGGEILNHAADHDSLLARPGEEQAARRQRILEQLDAAQQRINDEVPEECRSRVFSYPYGEFDSLAMEVLAGAGYAAFGQQSGPVAEWDSLQALPRFPVNQAFADASLMTTKLLSLPFPDVLERTDPVAVDNPPVLRLRAFPEADRVRCFDGAGVALERAIENGLYLFRASAPLAKGRNRYNCTYPAESGQRYHWLSQFWYVP